MKNLPTFEEFVNKNLTESVDMDELKFTLDKIKKENSGKKVGYFFTKDSSKGYKISIDGKHIDDKKKK